MSGRRTRDAVKKVLDNLGPSQNNEVVIAGLSNTYSSYVATYEEYQVQRYEGASTIYGPHTLQAYIQQYEILARALSTGEDLPPGQAPKDLLSEQISLLPGVIFDSPSFGKSFGDVITDTAYSYSPGSTASATFVSGHPRNNAQLERTFLTVEKLNPVTGNWTVVANDANWETKFYWKRTNRLFGHSESTVTWDIPENVEPGRYRIKHFGFHKTVFQKIIPYEGTSQQFLVQ